MKKLLLLLITVFITVAIFAQAPDKMTYQAVVRDVNDNLLSNQTVGMRISILQNSTLV